MKARALLTSLLLIANATVTHAAPTAKYTAAEEALLLEIKSKTIELVERQKDEAEKLRRCFSFANLCDPQVKEKLPLIKKAVKQKSEEYRLLVGLANADSLMNNVNSARISMTLPFVHFERRFDQNTSELKLIRKIHNEDYDAITAKTALMYKDQPKSPYVNLEGYSITHEMAAAKKFYSMQALLIIHQVPFVIYLKSDKPTENDIGMALGKYIERVQKALSDLYDIEKNPLESFLVYEPIVTSLIENDPQNKALLENLLHQQKHAVGLKAWIERNSPSLKLAALTTCSLVSAVLQAWPVSLACGGTATALTGKQLYDDYHRMRDNFALWLTGAQSHAALKTSEARVMYSTLALFFAGQSVGNTLIAIETSLVTTLSNLPAVAGARFTSLTALRESGIRFASRTIEMKGKDLGASIFAASYANITDKNLQTSREERIFTYKDLLLLQEAAKTGKP